MDFNIGSVLKLVSEACGMLVALKLGPKHEESEIHENNPGSLDPSSSSPSYLEKLGFQVLDPRVKSGATCMLDGLGADEIFCGYQRYRASYLRGGHSSMANEMKFGNI